MKIKLFTTLSLALIAASVAFSVSAKEIKIYVSPTGNDQNNGTLTAPLKTIGKASEIVRVLRKQTPDKAVVVSVGGGIYPLEKPVILTSEDSGSKDAPVIYKAADGEKPVFTGSVPLKNWNQLTNPEKLKILSQEVNGKVYVTDLKSAGIADFGDPTEIGKRPELFCKDQVQTLA